MEKEDLIVLTVRYVENDIVKQQEWMISMTVR